MENRAQGLSLLYRVCDTIRLVPVRFRRTDHGRVVIARIIAGGEIALKLSDRVRNWHPTHDAISL